MFRLFPILIVYVVFGYLFLLCDFCFIFSCLTFALLAQFFNQNITLQCLFKTYYLSSQCFVCCVRESVMCSL